MLQLGGSLSDAVMTLSNVLDDRASELVANPVRSLLISLKVSRSAAIAVIMLSGCAQAGDFQQSSNQLDLILDLEKKIEASENSDRAATSGIQDMLNQQIASTEQLRLSEEVSTRLWVVATLMALCCNRAPSASSGHPLMLRLPRSRHTVPHTF